MSRIATLATVLAIAPCFAAGARADTTCSYSGPPANLLSLNATDASVPVISRHGDEIRIDDYDPVTCVGATPTVLNTDLIKIELHTTRFYAVLQLSGGSLAPGATPEADGASEIEVEMTGPHAPIEVHGTSGPDAFQWVAAGAHPGLNLNPGAGDTDADVTISGAGGTISAFGEAGSDTIVPQAGAQFDGDPVETVGGADDDVLAAPDIVGSTLDGGTGADTITGGSGHDLIYGGPGRDRIDGRGGADSIYGGPGRDVIFGGPGPDFILAWDRTRDIVDCGTGRDRVAAERRDQLTGCERVRRPTDRRAAARRPVGSELALSSNAGVGRSAWQGPVLGFNRDALGAGLRGR